MLKKKTLCIAPHPPTILCTGASAYATVVTHPQPIPARSTGITFAPYYDPPLSFSLYILHPLPPPAPVSSLPYSLFNQPPLPPSRPCPSSSPLLGSSATSPFHLPLPQSCQVHRAHPEHHLPTSHPPLLTNREGTTGTSFCKSPAPAHLPYKFPKDKTIPAPNVIGTSYSTPLVPVALNLQSPLAPHQILTTHVLPPLPHAPFLLPRADRSLHHAMTTTAIASNVRRRAVNRSIAIALAAVVISETVTPRFNLFLHDTLPSLCPSCLSPQEFVLHYYIYYNLASPLNLSKRNITSAP